MLIVIEGLDGAGKSTQVKRLKAYLEENVPSLEYIHFPRYDAPVYGDLIGRFLRGDFGNLDSVHPQLVALLFAEDRHNAAAYIMKALEEGKTVLLDRYVYSNIAYQCSKLQDSARREELRDWIFNTEYNIFGEPRPDLNIFLDVPISFVESKLKANRQGADRDYLGGSRDIHEADIEFQKSVRSMYLQQTGLDPDFIRVDCSDEQGRMLPPDAIFRKIKEIVSAKINA
ncbi:MAG: dTMP kinase [Bacteroidales bacterium]|nr:dTMP kinase [Bacteroidales bacterium]